jgi:hypothetical protein
MSLVDLNDKKSALNASISKPSVKTKNLSKDKGVAKIKGNSSKSRHISMNDIENARNEAERRDLHDKDTEELGPIIIKEDITLKEALEFVIHHEKLPFRMNFVPYSPEDDSADLDADKILGKYFAYDLPKLGHEIAASEIKTQIAKSIQRAANNIDVIDELKMPNSPLVRIGGKGKEPDGTLSPKQLRIGGAIRDDGFGFPFPSLVIEIALTHESLNSLKTELLDWIGNHTSVQAAIGVKIFGKRVDGSRRMVALLYRRNHSPLQIEFGSDLENISGLYLSFPITDLYVGVDFQDIPNVMKPLLEIPAQIIIDLAKLQAEIIANF